MSRSFTILLAAVIIVGLAMGAGLGMWRNQGTAGTPLVAQGAGGPSDQGSQGAASTGGSAGTSGQSAQGDANTVVFGTIETISDKSLVISNQSGSTRVDTADDTKIIISEAVTADQIKVGDAIVASGQKGEDGSITADSVDVGSTDATGIFQSMRSDQRPAGTALRSGSTGSDSAASTPGSAPQGRERVAGTVDAVSGKELTVKTDGGSTKVILTDQTAIRGTKMGTISDLKAGATVTVVGKRGSDGTVAASAIRLGDGSGLGFTRGQAPGAQSQRQGAQTPAAEAPPAQTPSPAQTPTTQPQQPGG